MKEQYRKLLDDIKNTGKGIWEQQAEGKRFCHVFMAPPRLVVLGGGHVSLPVVQMGKMLGYQVVVADDREEFANKDRFSMADQLVCAPFEEVWDEIADMDNSFYVVVTRGHAADQLCVERILKRKYAYLGMIGSRRKAARTFENLREAGYPEEQIKTIHAPIGLPIGGRTPEEIAVSIHGEIIQERYRNKTESFDPEVEKAIREEEPMVMVTIVEKAGSTPRDVGSRMAVTKDGRCFGSIGGGNLEYAAAKIAADSFGKDPFLCSLSLGEEDQAFLGMVCGGDVTLLFEAD